MLVGTTIIFTGYAIHIVVGNTNNWLTLCIAFTRYVKWLSLEITWITINGVGQWFNQILPHTWLRPRQLTILVFTHGNGILHK